MIKGLCYNMGMSKKVRGGFTLIELSLSLIFIAILSLTVVFLIQNISASYRRGLILNQVNTVGMDLVDEFRISIQNASSDPVTMICEIYYGKGTTNYQNCVADKAYSFVSVTKTARVTVTDTNRTILNKDMPVFGALCTGTYTYVWNTGYFENPDTGTDRRTVNASQAVVGFRDSITAPFSQQYSGFRLLKIYDDERSICVNAMEDQTRSNVTAQYLKRASYQNNLVSNQFVIDRAMVQGNVNADAVEVLKTDKAADLVLYELYMAQPALSSTRQNLFYAASFILGTRRGGINITQAGNSCKPPSDDYSELDYCAINKFNFAVMAGGGS